MPFDSVDNSSRRGVPQLVPTGEQKGKAPILLNRPVYQIGARESCRIRLISSTVSQVHALLVQTRHVTYVRDLASRNGVFVNGQKIREMALHDGDRLKIGRFEFVFRGPKKQHGDEVPALPSTLEVTGSPIPVPIEERVVLIGRRKSADIPLLEESVSNAHAVIFQWESKRFIRDLGSRTHTFLNGKKIHEKELSPNDVIKVGETEIRYTPSTEIAAVDVVESASDSQIAMAPSAEEVDFGIDLAAADASRSKLADTIGDIDITDTSHHDTAVIPLSLQTPSVADTVPADDGLELLHDRTDEPMPRSWREASTNDQAPLDVEEPAPPVTLDSIAREESTDLGLTSHLDELSPAGASIEPLQLTPADAPAEGNATIDLSGVNFDTATTHASDPEILPDAERPLIADDGLIETAPIISDDISADDTLAGDAPPLEPQTDAPAAEEVPPLELEKVEVIDATEPTPESALDVPPASIDENVRVLESETLSDTSFGRQVEEFTAPSTTGDIVEPLAEAPAAQPALDLSLPLLPPISVSDSVADAMATPDAAPAIEPPPAEGVDELALAALNETPAEPQEISFSAEPTQLAPKELAPGETASPEIAPVEVVPDEISPAEIAPVEIAPADTAPVELGTAEGSSVESEPIESEPIESEPVEIASVETAPVEISPMEFPPADVAAEAASPAESIIEPPAPEAPLESSEPIVPVLDLETPPEELRIEVPESSPEPIIHEELVEPVAEAPMLESAAPAESLDLPSLDDLAMEALASSETIPAPVLDDQVELPSASAASSEMDVSSPVEVAPQPLMDESNLMSSADDAEPAIPVDLNASLPVESPSISDEPALESVPETIEPTGNFEASSPEPVELPLEPAVSETPTVEGNAVIAPSVEPAEETTVSAPELSADDLISPPIEPLDPQLEEIDLGLEPIPDTPREPQADAKSEPPASDSSPKSEIPPGGLTGLSSPTTTGDPFEMPSLATALPPRPLKKRRERGRPTVIRNFGKDQSAADAPVESPFAAAKPGDEPAIAFDAAEGSVDVFGAASPEVADSLLSALESKLVPDEAVETRPNRRRGRETPGARVPQPMTEARRPAVTYGEMALAAADAEARRKKLLRAMLPVALVGILVSAAAALGAWYFVPVIYDIQASVRFAKLGASDMQTQAVFRENQLANLRMDATRRAAILKLKDQFPQVSPGFLGESEKYMRAVASAAWSDQETGLLQLRYGGTDRTEDNARMFAVVLAIYNTNGDLVQRAGDATRNFNEIDRIISRSNAKIIELNERIENDRLKIERYQSEKLTAANIQLQNLDKAYQDAFASLKGAQAELDRLKKTSPVVPSTQPVESNIATDGELAALSQKSQELATRLNQARAERAELAKQARESLDAAYQQFQKQIEASQGAMQQSPELAKFVDTVQSQMKIVRELTDDFIASQQKEYQQLAEAKAKLDEKMQTRRADLWARDEQLQELAGQREITIRKLNAAKSDNLDKEIESIQTDLSLIETNIKARQDVLATDPLYAEVITTLQQLIESKQKELLENRKKTDEKLATLQKQFAASLPTVEKLPQEQQALASEMKQRLGEIDAARRQYASAADQASVENDVVIKSMAQQLASLQGDMEIRKQQILAAQNGVAVKQLSEQIAQKEKEVAELTLSKDKAEQAFFSGQALVRELTTARAEAEAAMSDRYEAQQQKTIVEGQLAQSQSDLKNKKNTMDSAITPIEPLPKDVQVISESDKRLVASISAGGGALLLTALCVLWLSFAAARANPFAHHTAETEEGHEEPHENEPAVV
jgi:pSer/pThr/pTyr-binding forkhead associated (FHA) protein